MLEKQWNGLAVTKVLNPFIIYFEVSNSDLRRSIEIMTVCYTVGSQVHRLELHMWCTGTVTTTQRQASQKFQRQGEARTRKTDGAVPL